MNKNLYAVILAGGCGTRFWPLSRPKRPKQFLPIAGEKTLFEKTIERIIPAIERRNIYIVANVRYDKEIKKQAAFFKIPHKNILLEPSGKNTAPAIAWAAACIERIDPQAIMAVLPSDHLILKPAVFLKHIEEALRLAREGYLVTMGIVPTRPETGYGYLKVKTIREGDRRFLKVERFVEKPPAEKAAQFFKEKKYLWNSGMFVWKTETILKAFEKYLPEVCRLLRLQDNLNDVRRIWDQIPNVSVDYGILEKAHHVAAVAGHDMGWSDVGSWEALWEVLSKDKKGNTLKGNIVSLDCENSLIHSGKRLVVAIGLKGVVIVDTPDCLLVCRKEASQRIKEVVAALQENRTTKHRTTRHKTTGAQD